MGLIACGLSQNIQGTSAMTFNTTTVDYPVNQSMVGTTDQTFSPTVTLDPIVEVYNKLKYAQDVYALPILCPIGITGNAFVANNLFKKRQSNSSFIYMVAILVADILSLISDMFLPIARFLEMFNIDSVYKAAVFMYFWNADVFSFLFRRFSLNVFCVLSYERLTAIRKPFSLYKSPTVKYSYAFIAGAFIVAFLATIVTPLFTTMVPKSNPLTNSTMYVHSLTSFYLRYDKVFDIAMIVLRFLDGPVQILFFSVINIMIVKVLYKNKQSMALSNNQNRSKSISKLQTRLCKIFLILSVTNMLAFLPNSCIIIVGKLFPETGLNIHSNTMKLVMFGGNILRVVNSLTDFLVFVLMSKEVREDLKQKCSCGKPNDGKVDQPQSNTSVETISGTGNQL